jgi:hypothetical protein
MVGNLSIRHCLAVVVELPIGATKDDRFGHEGDADATTHAARGVRRLEAFTRKPTTQLGLTTAAVPSKLVAARDG